MYAVLYEGMVHKHLIVFADIDEAKMGEKIRFEMLKELRETGDNELYYTDFLEKLNESAIIFRNINIGSVSQFRYLDSNLLED
jgi:hypothetical protein